MSEEIERKWLVKQLPSLINKPKVHYERFILPSEPGVERRIQLKENQYQLETHIPSSTLSRQKTTQLISKEEFEKLKVSAIAYIVRNSYQISSQPNISVKIYGGKFKGLFRVEVEFTSELEAQAFIPLDWFGAEITHTPLTRDALLVKLTDEEFQGILQELQG